MKQFYILSIFVFGLQFSYGQIGFEENSILNDFDGSSSFDDVPIFSSDIDGDGDKDVVSINDDSVYWYRNLDGLGDFGEKIIVEEDVIVSDAILICLDLDNDGFNDIIIGDNSGIYWYRNLDGLGNFGSSQSIYSSSQAKSISAVDIDGDGDLDILSAVWVSVVLLENDGFGNFDLSQTINGYGAFRDAKAIDINNDGHKDILTSFYSWNSDDSFLWFENNGTEEFIQEHIIDENVNITQSSGGIVEAADMDSDGDIDVLLSEGGGVVWYENIDGNGTYQNAPNFIGTTSGNGVYFFKVDDLNNDTYPDILLQNPSPNNLKLAINDGSGGFSLGNTQSIPISSGLYPIFIDDINNDGNKDIIGYSMSTLSWFDYNNGNFDKINQIASNDGVLKNAIAIDIDNDGDSDLVTKSRNRISTYKNLDGSGTFGKQKVQLINQGFAFGGVNYSNNNENIHYSDFDNDGDLDLLVPFLTNNEVAWLENVNGSGDFEIFHSISTSINTPGFVYAADLDDDGDEDVIAGGSDKLVWYENIDGSGNFGNENIIMSTSSNNTLTDFKSIYVIDFDNDNDSDIISSSRYSNEILIFENIDGIGTFNLSNSISTNEIPRVVTSFDIDNDGDYDVICGLINSILLYRNDGANNFSEIITISDEVSSISSLFIADLDLDGDVDLVSSSIDDDKIAWYENLDGLGNFGVQQIISSENNFAQSVYSSDIDGDGLLDVISTSGYGSLYYYKNSGDFSNEINGIIRFDSNSNSCDSNDSSVNNILIETTDGVNSISTFNLDNGFYQLFPSQGEFTTTIVSELPNYYTSNPISQSSNFVGVGNTDIINFCIEPAGAFNDLNISVYPSIDNPRPGFDTTYQIVYKNIGTTQLSGSVSFEFDDAKIQFLSASETVSSQTVNTLNFNFTDLNPFETRTIDLEFNVFPPPTTNIDDILVSTATVSPVTGDETEEDNVFILEQTVIGSYDPNDITVLEGEEITIDEADKYLHYLIRFQNTGTASAINVNVEHVLDDKLDWSTMQLESLSHTGRVEITDQTDVSFVFDNINLPDSTNDEPNSHGYIAFKIKPKSDVIVGDVFSAVADIYFDFNPPIITNTAVTEIVEQLSVNQFKKQSIQLFPNPAKNKLEISSNFIIDKLTIIDINGRELNSVEVLNTDYTMDLIDLSKGVYFLEIQSGNSKSTKKFIKN